MATTPKTVATRDLTAERTKEATSTQRPSTAGTSELTGTTWSKRKEEKWDDHYSTHEHSIADVRKGVRDLSPDELKVKVDQLVYTFSFQYGERVTSQRRGQSKDEGLIRFCPSCVLTNQSSYPLLYARQKAVLTAVEDTGTVPDMERRHGKSYLHMSILDSILPGESSGVYITTKTKDKRGIFYRHVDGFIIQDNIQEKEAIQTKEIHYAYYDPQRQTITEVIYDATTQTYRQIQEQALSDRFPSPAVKYTAFRLNFLGTQPITSSYDPDHVEAWFNVTNTSSVTARILSMTFLNLKSKDKEAPDIVKRKWIAGCYRDSWCLQPGEVSDNFSIIIGKDQSAQDLVVTKIHYDYYDNGVDQGTYEVTFDNQVGIIERMLFHPSL